MSEQLTITKERILEAAANCDTAKKTLKVLFPEAFRPEEVKIVKREESKDKYHEDILLIDANKKTWLVLNDYDGLQLNGFFYEWELKRESANYYSLTPTRK